MNPRVYLTIFRTFILRVFRREKMRVAVTVLGIGLGVAVMVAMRLGNRTALDSFRQATESVAGAASVEIVGSAGRFDEMLASDLLWLREYGQLSPVIDGYALYEGTDAPPEFLRVLGTDILRDWEVREYRLLRLHRDGEQPTRRKRSKRYLRTSRSRRMSVPRMRRNSGGASAPS